MISEKISNYKRSSWWKKIFILIFTVVWDKVESLLFIFIYILFYISLKNIIYDANISVSFILEISQISYNTKKKICILFWSFIFNYTIFLRYRYNFWNSIWNFLYYIWKRIFFRKRSVLWTSLFFPFENRRRTYTRVISRIAKSFDSNKKHIRRFFLVY